MKNLIKEGRIALDIETSGLRPYQHIIHLIAIGNEDTQKVYNYHTMSASDKAVLVLMLENREIEKIGHNIAFDAFWLAVHLNCRPANLYCTMTMEKVSLGGRWLGDSDETAAHGMAMYNLEKTLKRHGLWKEGYGQRYRKNFHRLHRIYLY